MLLCMCAAVIKYFNETTLNLGSYKAKIVVPHREAANAKFGCAPIYCKGSAILPESSSEVICACAVDSLATSGS